MIFGSTISRRSLVLIFCRFQVHMSTPTSQTKSLKLAVEMYFLSHLFFAVVKDFHLTGQPHVQSKAKTSNIPRYQSQDHQDGSSDRLRYFSSVQQAWWPWLCIILKYNGHLETFQMKCYFVVDVGMEMSSGATHHNELDHMPHQSR